jgi:hypothetical protein
MEHVMKTATITAEITVKDHGIEVTEAPDFAKISLELLNMAKAGFRIHGNMISIGGYAMKWVSYQVIGIADEGRALWVRREDVDASRTPSLPG